MPFMEKRGGRPGLPAEMQPKEQSTVTAILQLLRFKSIPHTHVRNSGRVVGRGQGAARTLRYMHDPLAVKGVADIIACHKGRAVAIEVKSPTGTASPEQIEWLLSWEKSGGLAMVARSVGAVEAWLDQMPLTGPYVPMQL